MTNIPQTGFEYIAAGLSALPAIASQKRPTVSWRKYQHELPDPEIFDGAKGVCIICGAVSGNLEMIDFDYRAVAFDEWAKYVPVDLLNRLVIEESQSGGRHVVYRCQSTVDGNQKLATKIIKAGPGIDTINFHGKTVKVDKDGNARPCLIETRGEGGLFLCTPTPGYRLIQGDFMKLPVLTAEEREELLSSARIQSNVDDFDKVESNAVSKMDVGKMKPGEDYNERGDVAALLTSSGWKLVQDGSNQLWRRPGKNSGVSATLKDRVFYVHTTSTTFEPQKGYSPFAVYATIKHGTDFEAAARALRAEGYGTPANNGGQRQGQSQDRDTDRDRKTYPSKNQKSDGTPPQILIETDEHRVISQTIAALALDETIYCRGGRLVRSCQTDPGDTGRIQLLPQPVLRTKMTKFARFVKYRGADLSPAHPPEWLVKGVDAQGDWPGIRRLNGITDTPILRRDGSVWQNPGYDAATGVYYNPPETGEVIIPDGINIDDADAAVNELLDLVADFAFEGDEHRSAWLAFLLTPFARYAFTGPSPLFLVDANVRGAGKGLLTQTVGHIVLGREMPNTTYSRDEEEMRKAITSLAIAGDRIVCFDNIEGDFGNPILDSALTSNRWRDRILGGNTTIDLPMMATWCATGNNVQIAADTARRTIHVRLDVPVENPEDRRGFRHPQLLEHIDENRGSLVKCCLTILAAYLRSGAPRADVNPFGSFEGWSRVVREAVIWAGQPDPCQTRKALADRADNSSESLMTLIAAWEEFDPMNGGIVVNDLIRELWRSEYRPADPASAGMRTALESLVNCPAGRIPSAKSVSMKIKSFTGRFCQGRRIVPVARKSSGMVWRLEASKEVKPRLSADSIKTPTAK